MPTALSTRRTFRQNAEQLVPRVPWEELGPQFIESWGWPGGKYEPEHLTVYGRSGSGKTYFVAYVLDQRARLRGSHVTMVATKRADATLTRLGWPIVTSWPPGYGQTSVIFWAKARGISAVHLIPQRKKVKDLMDTLWRPNANMVVYWDELTYIEQDLRLKREIATFYREGRTHGITNVATMQRPAYVSRLAHSEAGWTVAFPPKDMDDRKRIAEVLGDRALYMEILPTLDQTRHEFVIKHERTGNVYISHLPEARGARAAGRPVAARGGSYGVRSAR